MSQAEANNSPFGKLARRLKSHARPSLVVFILLVCLGVVLLAVTPRRALWDQSALLENTGSVSEYPGFNSGVVSKLLVVSYRFLVNPGADALNLHVRCFALVLFLLGAFLLARKVLVGEWYLVLFMALVFCSRYPFLWLSSELFAGALVCLALCGLVSGWHPLLTGVLLGVTALAKPDLPLLMLVFLTVYSVKLKDKRKISQLVSGFAISVLLLLLPGIVQRGSGYFQAYRSFFAFGQHYSALVFPHLPGNEQAGQFYPWHNWKQFMDSSFPDAENFIQVVFLYPRKYLDFVVLSAVQGLVNLVSVAHFLLVPLALRVVQGVRRGIVPTAEGVPREYQKYFFLSLIGLLPFVFVSYLHVRYLARYFPLFVLFLLVFLERPVEVETSFGKRWHRIAALSSTMIALVYQLIILVIDYAGIEGASVYWFPD